MVLRNEISSILEHNSIFYNFSNIHGFNVQLEFQTKKLYQHTSKPRNLANYYNQKTEKTYSKNKK